jgi:hypothetical protein
MGREKRFRTILRLLDEQERVNVEDLAAHFDGSPETIRRDLSSMSEQGLLRKVNGGAVKFQSAQENSFALSTLQPSCRLINNDFLNVSDTMPFSREWPTPAPANTFTFFKNIRMRQGLLMRSIYRRNLLSARG